MKHIPQALKNWFMVHFIVDYVFGFLLFFFPIYILELLGQYPIDVFSIRIVAAILFAIGGISFWYRKTSFEHYQIILSIKITWSVASVLGISLSMFYGLNYLNSIFLLLFLSFGIIWFYYQNKLRAM